MTNNPTPWNTDPGGIVPIPRDWAIDVRDGYRQLCPTGAANTITLEDLAAHIHRSLEVTKTAAEWCYPRDLIGEGVIGIGQL